MVNRWYRCRAGRAVLMHVSVVGCVMMAGCSSDDDPSEDRVIPSAEPTAAPASDAPAPASRPVDLPLDDVDPCELFTPGIVAEFGLRGEVLPEIDSQGQLTCQMLAGPPGGYIAAAATHEGMERFVGIPEDMATVQELTIGGFTAAELRDAHQPSACLIGIDVADGQHLSIYASDIPDGGSRDEVCGNAVSFAEAILDVLRQ